MDSATVAAAVRLRRRVELLAVLGAGAVVASCHTDRPTAPAPDRSPPIVRVISPTASSYDLDGDSLTDLALQWTDSGGAVEAAAVRVRSLTGVNGPSGDTTNLLNLWQVERRDGVGLLVHETMKYLLHGGINRLEVTVPDSAGNVTVDTITFTLPYAALLKTIASGITGTLPATGVALCSDDHRFYMPVGNSLVIVDADSLRLLQVVPPSLLMGSVTGQLWQPRCIPGDPVLYIAADNGLIRFNRSTSQWLQNVGTFTTANIAQSRADSDLLYLGWTGGEIGLARRSQDTTVGHLLTGSGSPQLNAIWDIAVLAGDTKLYAAYYYTGIWVVDPRRDSVLDSITVAGASFEIQSFALTRDDQHLYASAEYGNPRGVHEINTATDQDVRSISTNPFPAIRLALSPDEKRIFVTTQDNGSLQSSNALMDVPSWRVIQLLPRPRPPGNIRYDQGVVFHPSGRYIFVAHDWDVDVYLHRP